MLVHIIIYYVINIASLALINFLPAALLIKHKYRDIFFLESLVSIHLVNYW
jgi:hypothetical protein